MPAPHDLAVEPLAGDTEADQPIWKPTTEPGAPSIRMTTVKIAFARSPVISHRSTR